MWLLPTELQMCSNSKSTSVCLLVMAGFRTFFLWTPPGRERLKGSNSAEGIVSMEISYGFPASASLIVEGLRETDLMMYHPASHQWDGAGTPENVRRPPQLLRA